MDKNVLLIWQKAISETKDGGGRVPSWLKHLSVFPFCSKGLEIRREVWNPSDSGIKFWSCFYLLSEFFSSLYSLKIKLFGISLKLINHYFSSRWSVFRMLLTWTNWQGSQCPPTLIIYQNFKVRKPVCHVNKLWVWLVQSQKCIKLICFSRIFYWAAFTINI